MWAWVFISTLHACQYLWRPTGTTKRGGSLGAIVSGWCELPNPNVGAGNQNQVIWKSNKRQPLSHCSSPFHIALSLPLVVLLALLWITFLDFDIVSTMQMSIEVLPEFSLLWSTTWKFPSRQSVVGSHGAYLLMHHFSGTSALFCLEHGFWSQLIALFCHAIDVMYVHMCVCIWLHKLWRLIKSLVIYLGQKQKSTKTACE